MGKTIGQETGKSGSGSGRSGSSRSGSNGSSRGQRDRFRAIQTEDENSDHEGQGKLVKTITESVAKAVAESLKSLKLDSKKSSKRSYRSKKD